MPMEIESSDGDIERSVLIGMIVDTDALNKIAPKWEKKGNLQSSWSNIIGGWCVKYALKYGKAPGKYILQLYQSWAKVTHNKEDKKIIERLLLDVNDEYKSLKRSSNSDYVVDLAAKHFNDVKAIKLAEEIASDIRNGDSDKVFKKITTFTKVELGKETHVDATKDKQVLKESMRVSNKPCLIKYPDDAGEFLNRLLVRDAFVSIEATEKKGKSFLLLDMAWRGVEQKRRVAFFDVGDQSQSQVIRRFGVRISQRPFTAQTVDIPRKLTLSHTGEEIELDVSTSQKIFRRDLSYKTAWKAVKKQTSKYGLKSRNYLRIVNRPNASCSILDIKSILQEWERTGWVADVIIIDYADILAPISATVDSREQINATWMQMRALSQHYHCLVVTATQASAKAYGAKYIAMEHFGNDKRKRAHVTASIGLNQTEREKDKGVMRMNLIVTREIPSTINKCLYVAGSLALANPIMKSLL